MHAWREKKAPTRMWNKDTRTRLETWKFCVYPASLLVTWIMPDVRLQSTLNLLWIHSNSIGKLRVSIQNSWIHTLNTKNFVDVYIETCFAFVIDMDNWISCSKSCLVIFDYQGLVVMYVLHDSIWVFRGRTNLFQPWVVVFLWQYLRRRRRLP